MYFQNIWLLLSIKFSIFKKIKYFKQMNSKLKIQMIFLKIRVNRNYKKSYFVYS